jgi:hypothetical protein
MKSTRQIKSETGMGLGTPVSELNQQVEEHDDNNNTNHFKPLEIRTNVVYVSFPSYPPTKERR